MLRVGHHAGRERDGPRIRCRCPDGQARGEHAPRQLSGPVGAGVREEDRELVTADPECPVGPPDLLAQKPSHLCQQLVAHGMTLRIVDLLELVEVQEHERQLVAVAPRLVELGFELLLERAVVSKTGQPVHECELADLLVRAVESSAGCLELGRRLQDLAGHPPGEDEEQGRERNQRRHLDRLQPVGPAGEDPQQRRPERHRHDGRGRDREVEAQADEPERVARRRRVRRGCPFGGWIARHGDQGRAPRRGSPTMVTCIPVLGPRPDPTNRHPCPRDHP